MNIQFTINKTTNVHKCFIDNRCIACYGIVKDLFMAGLLEDYQKKYENNIIVIDYCFNITEHNSLKDALEFIKNELIKY